MKNIITFALYFGNRGFFPSELIANARKELTQILVKNGYRYIIMDENLTNYGAVETLEEGKIYANFLKENEGKYHGIIICLPNFGDENGASMALIDCRVPVYVQAYRDEADKMDFAHRRDTVCGKIAILNVLRQNRIKYTIFQPFASNPSDAEFIAQLDKFAQVCRIVDGMKHFNLGAIGARTTAFKTVRFDEIAFANNGINTETLDLSDIIKRVNSVDNKSMEAKKADYLKITNYNGFPEEKLNSIAKIGVAIDNVIKEYDLQSIALRCWSEFQNYFGIAPCMILSELNERGIAASCELDVCNTVMMRAISLASDKPAMLLDLNNNYEKDKDKCILFHCGPIPISLMKGKGTTIEHKMFAKSFGAGSGVGVNKGEIAEFHTTFGSLKTENGKICSFVGEGELEKGFWGEEFFGSGIVLKKNNIEDMLEYIGLNGYRHHLCLTKGECSDSINEAFKNYLGYNIYKF